MNFENVDAPIVSIWSITFNQVNYIEKCLEGIVQQQTKFRYELIIGDDCSTDGTIDVLKKYEKLYPHIIKPIYNKNNLGVFENAYKIVYPKLIGKYIAICEGDDYWTDPYKLQKQVDFLEANPDYTLCFHNVKVYNQTTEQFIEDNITKNVSPTTTLADLAKGNYIHTPSAVFRKIPVLPDWFEKTPVGDYPLWCLNALKGKIYKMDEEMAVYRVHQQGAMQAIAKHNTLQKIKFNDGMLPFFEYMYKQSGIKLFQKKAIGRTHANRRFALEENNTELAKKYAKSALKKYLFQLSFSQLFVNLITLIVPSLAKKIH